MAGKYEDDRRHGERRTGTDRRSNWAEAVERTANMRARELLLKYDARHIRDCPQSLQNYWRLRPEYKPAGYRVDKPCICGLDDILGRPDWRQQS